jgi:small subunit ribosomal protein S6
MNTYEFTFLVEDAKATKAVEKALESFSGKKLNENAWGKRLLAYPINKVVGAEYFTWHIQIGATELDQFKQKLNYDNLVLRYLFLNQEHTPVQKEKKVVKTKEKEEVKEPEATKE